MFVFNAAAKWPNVVQGDRHPCCCGNLSHCPINAGRAPCTACVVAASQADRCTCTSCATGINAFSWQLPTKQVSPIWCTTNLVYTFFWLPCSRGLLVDLCSDVLHSLLSSSGVKGFVLAWPKYVGEELGQDAPKHQIGICDGQVATFSAESIVREA